MPALTEYVSYADAQRFWSPARLWELFDGDRERLNIAQECIDRHPADRPAVRIVHAPERGGHDETLTFGDLAAASSRFAHLLAARGIGAGDRVGIMLEPSAAFYASLFGAIKRGAIAVPLFTLFGPDGLRLRIEDCSPRLLLVSPAQADIARGVPGLETVVVDERFADALARYGDRYVPDTRADAVAVFQYTSGTTRELPAAVKHSHRSIVTLMVAALYGTGVRPGDEFFCPSSPAWGHGLWHGTLGPLALGVTTGAFAGRFDADRLLRALADHRITNLSAAATHYRMMKSAGTAGRYRYAIRKLSFTGEPIDEATRAFVEETFRTPVCSMYGTTEVGVILASYPGAPDFAVKPGSLGKPVPGQQVEVQRPDGTRCEPGEVGEIKVKRRDGWFATKDRGWTDEEGYFYHGGRADDVIISAGWTISAVEVEGALLKHPDVREAAVIGAPDPLRGLVVKAYIVSARPGDPAFARELQEWTRTRLAQHEYPRQVEFVPELPKTPAGKVNRKALRERLSQERV
ncbi:MAG TPA: AMP-binding protein [Methylomirabilota bacterium]|nr:AMP-binding protein [Methylomirabilota bacterium]